ncbi:unnamed protein product [Protopolystoma xenopodis]|uniref:Poly A polymerase head domain-containing protein n=1 Tax=Protopolystoma xenopodis TaxID=117903 RepID=A0A448X5G7_9PLAT|nr:unnamed protein product [Protopolystoma xenopodis]
MKNTSNFIDLSPYPSLYRPELVKLHGIFDKYGYELRAAGGAVRDILLNKEPHDIDLATVATPDQMLSMFSNESIRVINRNGEAHGTVTPRVDDSMNYEITTLRVDVKTDGRHAHVQFTHDWVTDAARRDLTINSLFLRLHYGKSANLETTLNSINRIIASSNLFQHPFGELFDYFGGRDDLSARRIRFVGEPADRIQEDYLRILRYFRFHALIKPPERADEHDDEILQVG